MHCMHASSDTCICTHAHACALTLSTPPPNSHTKKNIRARTQVHTHTHTHTPLTCTDARCILKAKLGIFRNIVAGFHAEEKQVVIDLCKRLGVRYHGDLVCGTTTHLVCKSVLGAVNTAKYLKAMEWGVQVGR